MSDVRRSLLPAWSFPHHLVHAEKEGLVAERPADTLLVDAKLSRCHSLPLWDLRKIELELLVVASFRG